MNPSTIVESGWVILVLISQPFGNGSTRLDITAPNEQVCIREADRLRNYYTATACVGPGTEIRYAFVDQPPPAECPAPTPLTECQRLDFNEDGRIGLPDKSEAEAAMARLFGSPCE